MRQGDEGSGHGVGMMRSRAQSIVRRQELSGTMRCKRGRESSPFCGARTVSRASELGEVNASCREATKPSSPFIFIPTCDGEMTWRDDDVEQPRGFRFQIDRPSPLLTHGFSFLILGDYFEPLVSSVLTRHCLIVVQ